MDRNSLAGAAALTLGLLWAGACSPAAEPRRPDVVLVTLDTLRPDYLGFLGFERTTAPFMAGLVEESVVLERAVSTSSWTAPSTASIFSGVYPNRHQVVAGLVAQARADSTASQTIAMRSIHSSLETIPQRLAAAGYRTYGLASNPSIRNELGFERGFERFECRPGAKAEGLIDTLIAELPREAQDAPRFVYLHLNDVHAPYAPHDPWYQKERNGRADQRQRYLSEISYVDSQLRRAFEHFGWDREAVVMIVSDHGEEFMDHRGLAHGFTLYAELNRVLFLFRSPRPGFTAARVAARASLVDVLPTLVELAGVAAPEDLDGSSLVALGDPAGRAQVELELSRRTLLAHRRDMRSDANLWAAMHGSWKLIVGDDGRPGRLYDLAEDPGEQDAIKDGSAEIEAALLAEVQLYRERATALPTDSEREIQLGSELLDQLRELGYVTDQ